MNLPLENRLKKRAHVQVALLQDELADLVYSVDEKAVLHGGTAIWRCYSGNRFSEDLDFYAPKSNSFDELPSKAKERGITVLKFKKTGNLLYSEFSNSEATVRLEATFVSNKQSVVAPFEKADGSVIQVLTLSPEHLILEKISAYKSRRLIRDLYDIFHLGGQVAEDGKVAKEITRFLEDLPTPVDEENLKAIVYAGAIPSFSQLKQALKRRWK